MLELNFDLFFVVNDIRVIINHQDLILINQVLEICLIMLDHLVHLYSMKYYQYNDDEQDHQLRHELELDYEIKSFVFIIEEYDLHTIFIIYIICYPNNSSFYTI